MLRCRMRRISCDCYAMLYAKAEAVTRYDDDRRRRTYLWTFPFEPVFAKWNKRIIYCRPTERIQSVSARVHFSEHTHTHVNWIWTILYWRVLRQLLHLVNVDLLISRHNRRWFICFVYRPVCMSILLTFLSQLAIASGNLRFICSHCSSTYSVNKRFGWRQLIGFGTSDDDLLHFKTDLLAAFTWSRTTPHTLSLLLLFFCSINQFLIHRNCLELHN